MVTSKEIFLCGIVVPYKILKRKHFSRNSCSKGFVRLQINVIGRVHPQKCCKDQVLNITKDKLVFRYIRSWPGVAHNKVSFHKTYLLMMITFISGFQWTVEVALL